MVLLVVFISAGAMVMFLSPHAQSMTDFLQQTLVDSQPTIPQAIIASFVASVWIFAFSAVTQNWKWSRNIIRYRHAEHELIKDGKLDPKDIVEYHSKYTWFSYAGLSFNTLLIVASLLVTGFDYDAAAIEKKLAITLSLLLLAIASVTLAVVDLYHTNGLSPLIPVGKRFENISVTIVIGTIAIITQVCAVSIFLSLINTWLSVSCSAVALFLVVFFAMNRGIPLAEIEAERNLSKEEAERVKRA